MNRRILSTVLAAFAATAAVAAKPPAQDARRVAEIAAMLDAQPGLPSCRIDNRGFWDRFRKDNGAGYTIRVAEKIMAEPLVLPDDAIYTNIVGEVWGKTSAKLTRNINRLLLAECIENKGRFIPCICAHLDAKASQTTWMNPYHDRPRFGNFYGKYRSIDLSNSEAALNVSMTLDTLKGKIPADLEKRMTDYMWKHIFTPYLDDAAGKGFRHGWFFCHNNWNAACHNQTVGAALRVIADRTTRAKFVEAAERAVPFFLNGFSKEGYCQEGLDYWNYGFTEYLRLGHMVRTATSGKLDLFAYEQAKRCYLYAYGFQLAENVSPQFGDGMASAPSKLNLFLGELVWPDLKCSFSSGVSPLAGGVELIHVLGKIPFAEFVSRASLPPFRYPLRTFFEDAQVLICRPETATVSSLSACIKGGHNGVPHNHNDAGQFIIAVGGTQMVQDPAGKAYDKDTFGPRRYLHPMLNSYAHAVPLPDGTLQGAGSKYTAKVLKTRFTGARDEITLDLKGAYNSTNIVKLERRMVYDRVNGTVTVSDDVLFAGPGTYESPISTFGEIVKGAVSGSYTIVRDSKEGEKRLDFTVVTPGATWTLKEEKIPNPTRMEPTRWAVVIDKPSVRHAVTFRFNVGRAVSEKPDPRYSNRLGVGMECLDRDLWNPFPAMPHLKELGIKSVRLQSGWARTEKVKGRLDFAWLDKIVSALDEIGVTPWISLSYGNPIYAAACDGEQTYTGQKMNPLHSKEGLDAWKRYVKAIVSRYRNRVDVWEVWNEPDLSVFLNVGMHGDWSEEYAELARITAATVREVQPQAKIAVCTAGGPSGREHSSILLFEKGVGDFADIYTFHAYRAQPEQFNRQERDAFYGALRRYAPNIRFWRGEAGLSSRKSGRGALHFLPLSEGMQARWMSRNLVRDLSDPDISFTSYFHLFDFDHYTHEVTYHYGVLRDKDYSRKPSFHVLKRIKSFFDDGFTVPDNTISLTLDPVKRDAPTSDFAAVAGASIYCFRRKGIPFFAFTGTWPAQDDPEPVNVKARMFLGGVSRMIEDPVLLDLMDGSVTRLEVHKGWPAPAVRATLENHVKVITGAAALAPYVTLAPREAAAEDKSVRRQDTHE